MNKNMFAKVTCRYDDYKDEYGLRHDGTKCYDCFSFDELYKVLKRLYDEHILSHVHLEFCIRELTDKQAGEIVIPFKEGVAPLISLY